MKKHLTKKNIFFLTVAITAIVMLVYSCNKNPDSTSASQTNEEKQAIQAAIDSVNKNDVVSVSPATPITLPVIDNSSFTVLAKDGHIIGINGVKPVVNPKSGQVQALSCGAITNLTMTAVSAIPLSNGTMGCMLYNSWTYGGGVWVALFINGTQYRSSSTGYGLWQSSINGLSAECIQIAGGINGGSTFKDFVRTYCNSDTTGSSYFDSPITTYTVPSAFNGACGTAPTGTGTKGHHGK